MKQDTFRGRAAGTVRWRQLLGRSNKDPEPGLDHEAVAMQDCPINPEAGCRHRARAMHAAVVFVFLSPPAPAGVHASAAWLLLHPPGLGTPSRPGRRGPLAETSCRGIFLSFLHSSSESSQERKQDA